MLPEDHVCHCYHVSLLKLLNFARRERPARASQLSECLGAGTGCGWCIPVLEKIHEQAKAESQSSDPDLTSLVGQSPAEYMDARAEYLRSKQRNTFEGPA
jgi:bacterioferritin-associated ferredoxin